MGIMPPQTPNFFGGGHFMSSNNSMLEFTFSWYPAIFEETLFLKGRALCDGFAMPLPFNPKYGFEYLAGGFPELDWFDSGAKQMMRHFMPYGTESLKRQYRPKRA